MNFDDEQRKQFEKELEQVDEKTLLIQQLTELAAIRMQLQELNQNLSGDVETDSVDTKTCSACQQEVRESELESHAVEQHNAPADMAVEDLGLYV
jgi:hypothetical protein